WSEAARLALELLARQRFVPTLVETEDAFAARWEPLWDDPKDARRLAQLTASMPPACRSAAEAGGQRPARAVLEDFYRRCVDQAIRAWSEAPPVMPDRRDDEGERWISALVAPEPRMRGGRPLLRRLARDVQGWTAQL